MPSLDSPHSTVRLKGERRPRDAEFIELVLKTGEVSIQMPVPRMGQCREGEPHLERSPRTYRQMALMQVLTRSEWAPECPTHRGMTMD